MVEWKFPIQSFFLTEYFFLKEILFLRFKRKFLLLGDHHFFFLVYPRIYNSPPLISNIGHSIHANALCRSRIAHVRFFFKKKILFFFLSSSSVMVIIAFEDENCHSDSTVSGDVMESLQCFQSCREPHQQLDFLPTSANHLTVASQEIDYSLLDNPIAAAAIFYLEQKLLDQELKCQVLLDERNQAVQRLVHLQKSHAALEVSSTRYELELSRSNVRSAFPNVSHPVVDSKLPSAVTPVFHHEPLCASPQQVLECTNIGATPAHLSSSKDAFEFSFSSFGTSSNNFIQAKKPLEIYLRRHPSISSRDITAENLPSNKIIDFVLSGRCDTISTHRARTVHAKAFYRVSSALSSCVAIVSSVNALECLNAFRLLLKRRSLKRRKLKLPSLTCRLNISQHPAGSLRRTSSIVLIMVRCVDPP